MEVHTFRADSLQEALRQVRETLGPDAAVLHTREITQRRLGLFSRPVVEVDASCEMRVASRYSATKGTSPADHPVASEVSSSATSQAHGESSTSLQAAIGNDPGNAPRKEIEPPESPDASDSPHPQSSNARDRSNVSPIQAPGSVQRSAELTEAGLELLAELLDAGVEAELAKSLLHTACQRCGPVQQEDPWLLRVSVCQVIAGQFNVGGGIEIDPDEQTVVAFVGPTGVGKTTSLAKLATGFRVDVGCDVGLVTVDTFRLGAVDQLLHFAESISAPLEVVSSPDQIPDALVRLRECDLVLIDTSGRGPADHQQQRLLDRMLAQVQPDAIQLVVSATSSRRHFESTMRDFKSLKPTNLLITKLDESSDFGAWLPALNGCQLPISYLGSGQRVPQDLAVATSRRIARAMLGSDRSAVSGDHQFTAE